jgi:hypothetical protein
LSIPLLAGRLFRDDDLIGRPLIAIVNQEFVRSFGIEKNPIGRQLDDASGPITIVGVVGDVRLRGMQTSPEPQLYLPYLQYFLPNVYLLVRSPLKQAQLIGPVKTAIHSVDADQALFNASTMQQVLSSSLATLKFNATLVAMFSAIAILVASGGMYSVISCLVSQRTNEIAVRIALGATRAAIIKSIAGTTMIWVLAGLASGLGFALLAGNTIRSLTNSIGKDSPMMYVTALVLFLIVTCSAACAPLWRATRLDPAIALRWD